MKKVLKLTILSLILLSYTGCVSLGNLQEEPKLCLDKTEFCVEKNLDALRSEALNIYDHLKFTYKKLKLDMTTMPNLPKEVEGIDLATDLANINIYKAWNKEQRAYFEELKKKYDNVKEI